MAQGELSGVKHRWEVTIQTPEGERTYIAHDTTVNILTRIKNYLIKQKNEKEILAVDTS